VAIDRVRIPADPDSTLRTTTTPLQDEEETRAAKAAIRATDSYTIQEDADD
jgi:hypothetical protein